MSKNIHSVVPTAAHFPAAGPAHRTTPPSTDAHRFPAAGPAAHLVQLPDAARVRLTVPADVDAYLAALEDARQRQLDATSSSADDTVAAAYRATLERMLEDIGSARQRLAAGAYGVCTRCHASIPAERLQVRPVVAECVPCAAT